MKKRFPRYLDDKYKNINRKTGRIEFKLQQIHTNTSDKSIQDNVKKALFTPKINLYLDMIKRYIVKFLVFIFITLFIIGPITNNYYDILNNYQSSLDYDIDLKSFKPDSSNTSISTKSLATPDVVKSYNFQIEGHIKIKSGEVSSAYLVYSDLDKDITDQSFYPITYNLKERNSFIERLKVATHKRFSYLFKSYEYPTEMSFKEDILYARKEKNVERQPFQPLYLVLIDRSNHASINILLANAKSSATTLPVNGYAMVSQPDFSAIGIKPNIKFFTGKQILDAQNQDESSEIPITAEKYARDNSIIQAYLKNFFN